MNKPIKFRAWSNEHNRYCDFVTLDENGRWIGWIKSSGVYLTTTDIILEQDTGLKDKNGKMIREGDIVEGDMGIFEVKWYDLVAQFMFRPNIDMKWHPPFVYDQVNEMEVIGNIHENPELLGDKNITNKEGAE